MAAWRRVFSSASHSSSSPPIQKSVITQTLRFKSTSTELSHHNQHKHQHEFSKPNDFVRSWKPPKDPKEAQAKLAQMRREYAKQVKELRKEYIYEMELQKQEKQRKDEARREAIRIAKEEKMAAKAARDQARLAEWKIAQEEFRQTLLKERAEKLENWRLKEKQREEKKSKESELLRRKSSMWIDEADMEKKIIAAIVDITPL